MLKDLSQTSELLNTQHSRRKEGQFYIVMVSASVAFPHFISKRKKKREKGSETGWERRGQKGRDRWRDGEKGNKRCSNATVSVLHLSGLSVPYFLPHPHLPGHSLSKYTVLSSSVNTPPLNYASPGLRVEAQFTGMQFSNGLNSALQRIWFW